MIGTGGVGGGVYTKALRLLMLWFPTNVLRPKARQSTTVIVSGGCRFSFSGNSYKNIDCVFHRVTGKVLYTGRKKKNHQLK